MSIRILGKQSLIYGIGTILTRLVTFLLLPVYTNVFTPEQYGVVSLSYAFTGFVIVFYRYGMDTALMKFYIDAEGDEKKKYFTIIFSTQTATSLIFSGIVFVTASFLSPIFLGGEYKTLMQFVAIILFLDALRELPLLVLRANEKPRQFIFFSLINVLLLMGLNIYLVVFLKMGIEGVLVGNILASAIVLLATMPIIFQNFKIDSVNLNALKVVIKFGIPFLPAALFAMIMELSDRYLLEWLADTTAVGLYSAGNNFGKFGLLIVMGFNMGWTPYFLKKGKNNDAKQTFSQISKYFLGISGFFIVFISLWIDSIVRFKVGGVSFFGEDYWTSTQVVPILLLGYYLFGIYVLQLPGVFITNRTKWVPAFRSIGAILAVTIGILLIPLLGIIGAATAKAIAYFGMAFAIWINNKKYYNIQQSWRGILFPIVYLIIVVVIPLNFTLRIVLSFLYLVLWYLVVAENTDKQKIKSLIA
ncbi:lipopolysaccharide biosynthesis protein [Candidatus Neomarinimicrobiota bacterium]